MKPHQTTPPARVQEPKQRFRVQKLEERIAPKANKPFSWKCRPSW